MTHRNTKITMLPSRGKPNLELAAKLMMPLTIDALLKNESELAPTSSGKKLSTDIQKTNNSL